MCLMQRSRSPDPRRRSLDIVSFTPDRAECGRNKGEWQFALNSDEDGSGALPIVPML